MATRLKSPVAQVCCIREVSSALFIEPESTPNLEP